MANEPILTIVGNATADAEMRVLNSGAEVATFTVAVTPRVKDGDSWVDGEATFYRCSAWRQHAEPVAETVTRGMRLIVQGRLKTRSYEKDGQTRTSIELDVDAVGPELRYAKATVTKIDRNGGGGNRGSSGGWSGGSPSTSEPPF